MTSVPGPVEFSHRIPVDRARPQMQNLPLAGTTAGPIWRRPLEIPISTRFSLPNRVAIQSGTRLASKGAPGPTHVEDDRDCMALAEIRHDPYGLDADRGSAKGIYYQALVQSLERARSAIASDDVGGRCSAVRDATEAVTSLFLALKAPQSSLLPDSLSQRFSAAMSYLMRINLHNDPNVAPTVLELVEPLIEGHATDRAFRTGPDLLRQAR
jgi:flagellin-specific chaperone FliS